MKHRAKRKTQKAKSISLKDITANLRENITENHRRKPKRHKFNKHKTYGLRLSYAPIIDIHIRRNAEQKSSVFSVPNGSVP